VLKADNLPPSCAAVTKSVNLNFLEPSGPFWACNGTALPFLLKLKFHPCVITVISQQLLNNEGAILRSRFVFNRLKFDIHLYNTISATLCLHYKDRLFDYVYGMKRRVFWEIYKTLKYITWEKCIYLEY